MGLDHWLFIGGLIANCIMAFWNYLSAFRGLEQAKANLKTCEQNGEILARITAQHEQNHAEFNKILASIRALDKPGRGGDGQGV